MKKKKTLIIICVILALLIAAGCITAFFIYYLPKKQQRDTENAYAKAVSLKESGELEKAYDIFKKLDYLDSKVQSDEIVKENPGFAEVGDTLFFGSYEQDGNTDNGKEDLEWIVLSREDGKTLLITKYAVDCKRYNHIYTDENLTYADCYAKKWLDSTFLPDAFTPGESEKIEISHVPAEKNPDCPNIPQGEDVDAKAFLLSVDEVNKFFKNDAEKVCMPTPFAANAGVAVDESGCCRWWLRNIGANISYATVVEYNGKIGSKGTYVNSISCGIRPVISVTF